MNIFAKTACIALLTAGTVSASRADGNLRLPLPGDAGDPGALVTCWISPTEKAAEWDSPQESRDPGYQLYRDGYRLILGEKWAEARRKFAELMRAYPRSGYLDDARFWTAYSWKFSDRKKALDAYARFMKDFPASNYFDDAVAEYQRLGGTPETATSELPHGIPEAATRIAELEKHLAEIQQRFMVQTPRPPRMPLAPGREEPRTRVKMEALLALTRSPGDEKAFTALKEAALDTTQPVDVRVAALDGARRFRVPEVGNFLMTVVENSRDLRFRMMALDGLRVVTTQEHQTILNSVRSLALNQEEPAELRMSALQVLERGDREQFPKILVRIAKSDSHKPLQISALRYLSRQRQVEQQVAADVLREVALDQTRDPDVREVALVGLEQLTGAQASQTLIETARTDPQERVRLAAVYALGSSSRENAGPVIAVLEGLAADRSQPRLVRQTALAQLGVRGSLPNASFLATLASDEPDEEIQLMAIHVLGQVAQEEVKSFAVLTSLFHSIPDDRIRSKDVLLFSAASVGGDNAVDFLSTVAKENGNDALRERAVYYLGNIGTEKARNALLEILRRP
jgi:HEAT repeat protein